MKNIVTLKGKSIFIDFAKIFERNLSQYDEFKVIKRTYHKQINNIYDDIKLFVEDKECLDYTYNLLYFRYLINDNDKIMTKQEVVKFIREHFFSDEKLINEINKEINDNYTLNLDSMFAETTNENLQISDDLNKKFLKSAMLMRLLIPISSAISDKVDDIELLDKYIFEINSEILLFFNNEDNTILKKAYNIVSSRVMQTRYSEKDIWDFLLKQNSDITITIRLFNEYLMVNIFLKIMNNTSIISYIDVILKNKINYLFRLKYKVSHKTLDYYSNDNDDSNNLSEIDKLQLSLLRKDKGLLFLNKASIKMEVDNIKQQYNLDDLWFNDEFINCTRVNEFTNIFLSIFYKNKFDIVYDGKSEYYLLYNMLMKLYDMKYELIPMIITSECNSIKNHNKRMIREKLSDSVKYKLLLDKYQNVRKLLDENYINNLIIKIKQKRFLDADGNEIELEIEKLNEEILDFLFM